MKIRMNLFPMKWIALAGATLLTVAAANAQQGDFSQVQIKTTDLGNMTYMLEGQGGNIVVAVGTDGIIMVDCQLAPLHDKIKAAIEKISPLPIKYLINTHYHGDHTGGNVPFNNAGSTIIAQDNVRRRLESGGVAGNGGSIKMENKPAEKAALPIITFEHDVTVHLNGEDIRALHFPAGHTDGDSDVNTDSYTNGDAHGHTNSHTNGDSNGDSDGNSDSDSHCNAKRDSNGVPYAK